MTDGFVELDTQYVIASRRVDVFKMALGRCDLAEPESGQ